MIYTSAQAAKMLAKIQQDYERVKAQEKRSNVFLASVGEDPESVRPEYDYEAIRRKLDELEAKIRKVKHAINMFNTVTVVPGFDMTIDEILIYIPQLSRRKEKLQRMAEKLPKARVQGGYMSRSNIIDYEYINYDREKVQEDLDRVTEELSRAQLALDEVNHTLGPEIDI